MRSVLFNTARYTVFYEVEIWPGGMLGSYKFYFVFVMDVCAYFLL